MIIYHLETLCTFKDYSLFVNSIESSCYCWRSVWNEKLQVFVSDHSLLTGRGSPLFHGSLLGHCLAENMQQRLWWHSPRCHSNLIKKTHKNTKRKVIRVNLRVRFCWWKLDCSPIFRFFVLFICQSLILLSASLSHFFSLWFSDYCNFLFIHQTIYQQIWWHTDRRAFLQMTELLILTFQWQTSLFTWNSCVSLKPPAMSKAGESLVCFG